ncbi:MAG TPA: DUF2892 domain-containing protein [Cyclobacteriaceae bacterium]|nr:DUF2892 domain-containing protein [Cyclobacteriaceae bacterium]
MKKNIGIIDRIIRVVLAVFFVVLYFSGIVMGVWGVILLVLAGVFILTSVISWCLLYLPFGIRTYKPVETKSNQ